MNKFRKLGKKKGFTLIELIIVIVIIAILAAIAIPAMSGFKKDAEQSAAEANARTAYTALSAAGAKETVTASTKVMTYTALAAGNAYEKKVAELVGSGFPGSLKWTTVSATDTTIASVTWHKKDAGGAPSCTFTPANSSLFTHS